MIVGGSLDCVFREDVVLLLTELFKENVHANWFLTSTILPVSCSSAFCSCFVHE